MAAKFRMWQVVGLALLFIGLPAYIEALTGHELVQRMIDRHVGETFRSVLFVRTFEGNRLVSSQKLVMIGDVQRDESSFFLQFEEPRESKGIRLLFRITRSAEPEAFMFVPALGLTVQLKAGDPTADMGGTGLTMADFLPLLPRPGETPRLLGIKPIDGSPAYVIEFTAQPDEEKRILWVDRKRLTMVKMTHVGNRGETRRQVVVNRFKKTAEGHFIPIEEEITLPNKAIRILVQQTNVAFGIPIDRGLLNPESFGSARVKIN